MVRLAEARGVQLKNFKATASKFANRGSKQKLA